MAEHRNPAPTVDVVIRLPEDRVVLVERRFPPPGWALPGGFVDVGETVEAAAVREAREETGLEVTLEELLWVYSDPRRDPRKHTLSAVFVGRASGEPRGGDDAAQARAFRWDELPAPIAFDHAGILADARRFLLTGARPRP
jgi:8-oxo-dGTP diphosphatase